MAKFRFYITSTMDGNITGTNDEEQAKAYAESEDNFVVDADNGQWLQPGDDFDDVGPARELETEEEEESEEEEEEGDE